MPKELISGEADSMIGPRSVLVKLDGSAYSHIASELAIQWAQEFGCALRGISVVNEHRILTPQPEESVRETERREEQLREARAVADQYLESFAKCGHDIDIAVSTCRETGKSAAQILREVQRHDILLLGRETHFHTTVAPSASLEQVLRFSPRPVVTVPLSLPQGKSVLVAYDARPASSRALAALLQSGLAASRKIHVVCVRDNLQQAKADIALAVDYLNSHRIEASSHPIDTKTSADRAIMPLIGEHDVGLLITGAYGSSRTAEFFFGSTTRKLLKESPVPVFMFH